MKTAFAALLLAATASSALAQAEKADPGSLSGKAKQPTASTPAANPSSGNTGTSSGSSGTATPGGNDTFKSMPDKKIPNATEQEKTTKTTPNQPEGAK